MLCSKSFLMLDASQPFLSKSLDVDALLMMCLQSPPNSLLKFRAVSQSLPLMFMSNLMMTNS